MAAWSLGKVVPWLEIQKLVRSGSWHKFWGKKLDHLSSTSKQYTVHINNHKYIYIYHMYVHIYIYYVCNMCNPWNYRHQFLFLSDKTKYNMCQVSQPKPSIGDWHPGICTNKQTNKQTNIYWFLRPQWMFTPLKINMEHSRGGLEDHFPF